MAVVTRPFTQAVAHGLVVGLAAAIATPLVGIQQRCCGRGCIGNHGVARFFVGVFYHPVTMLASLA
jgi:hypothetical protein